MGLRQRRGHGHGIIEVGDGGQREAFARLQHRLGRVLNSLALRGLGLGEREGVVYHRGRVLVARLKAARDLPHPRHVHGRRQDAEQVEVVPRDDVALVAGDELHRHQPDGHIGAPLGGHLGHHQVVLGRLRDEEEPGGRRRRLPRRRRAARLPEPAHGLDTGLYPRQRPQVGGADAVEPQAPARAAV